MNNKQFKRTLSFVFSFLLTFSLFTPIIANAETTKVSSNEFDSLLSSTTSTEIILNSLLSNRIGSVTPGSNVNWTVDSTGEDLSYKFDLYKDSKLVTSNESKNNSFSTLLTNEGIYYVDITITNSNGASIKVLSQNISVKKIYVPALIHSVEGSVSSVNIGNTVRWTSYASGDSLSYKWEIYLDNKKVYTSSESSSNYIDYKITTAGNYKALSIVKDALGKVVTKYSVNLIAIKPPAPKPETPKPTPPSIDKLVKSSAVYATLTKSGKLTSSMGSSSTIVSLSKGSKVEILSDKGGKSYRVRDTKSGKIGWIASSYLSIPKDPSTNKNRMTSAQMEQYVNTKGFTSGTQYFIWVDLDRQLTNIFSGKKGSFKLIKSISCATGKNRTPTTRGTFTVSNRGAWFNSPTNPSVGAKYFVRFNGSYLFHSTLFSASNKNKAVDARVGTRLSNGCIRLPVNDAKWIYDNVKPGTKVFVN